MKKPRCRIHWLSWAAIPLVAWIVCTLTSAGAADEANLIPNSGFEEPHPDPPTDARDLPMQMVYRARDPL